MTSPQPPERGKLEACLCGGAAELLGGRKPDAWGEIGHVVECQECGMNTGMQRLSSTAIENWNRRAPPATDLARQLAEAREALQAVHDWRGLCDAGDLETFERISEMFHRETGFLRPGKDQAAAMGGYPTDEERRAEWDAWCHRKNDELNGQIRAVLARAESAGGGT